MLLKTILIKIIEFIATTAIGKKLDITFDKKVKASKIFVNYWQSLCNLDNLLGTIILLLDGALEKKKPLIFDKEIIKLKPEIEELSKMFIKNFGKTIRTISIIDPKLAVLLGGIISFKEKLSVELTVKSEFERPNFVGPNIFSPYFLSHREINLKKITRREYTDLINQYVDLDNLFIESRQVIDIVKKNMHWSKANPKYLDQVAILSDEIKNYKLVTSSARESLRQLIEREFSVEDILLTEK